MYKSNRIKSAFLKYMPLVTGLLILSTLFQIANDPNSRVEDILLIAIFPIILLAVFVFVSPKIQNVKVGRSKLIIFKGGDQREYSWLDVEEISLNRFTGLYKLILKDNSKLYFAAYGSVFWLWGDDSEMGQIIAKMKKELDI